MKNFFTGQFQKKVPKTLNDCIKPDSTSKKLWDGAEKLEEWGYILFSFIIIYGIIITISTGITTYQTISIADEDNATLATLLSVLKSIFTFGLYAFIERCIFYAITLLVDALASIVQNTNVYTNLSLYSIKGKPGDKFSVPKEENENDINEIKEIKKDDVLPININVLNQNDDKTSDETPEEDYIDINCPHCNKYLSFPNETKIAICPWCNGEFNLNKKQ